MKIDLRSDTVTRPTPGMLDAMFKAEVGDDVFGEDATINALEERAAKMFGKEAGLFCPSGTMTNQIAINVLTKPGDEVVCDYTSHVYQYEGGGIARNSGVQAKLLTGDRGRISAQQVEESINQIFDWLTRTKLVSIENTGNKAGGSYYTLQQMKDLSEVCHRNGLLMHLDGARIFNAVIEAGYTPAQIGPLFDSISVCMSKGLGAPAGSVLLGSKDFIREARRARKVFGGGMRQAGYFAAAGLYALEHHIERLKDDHRRAKVLADVIGKLPYVKELLPVETNILIFTLHDAIPLDYFMGKLNDNGIQCAIFGKQTVRFVTHLDINDDMIEKTISVLKKIN
jgi:threonine aldolase